MVNVAVPVNSFLSVTWAVNPNSPALVGVPDNLPVAAFSDTPSGKLPVVISKVYGDAPPLATKLAL